MKAVVGWLSDPYLHMILIVLVVVRVSMGLGSNQQPQEPTRPTVECRVCHDMHDNDRECVERVALAR
jgi:hypothetical protein